MRDKTKSDTTRTPFSKSGRYMRRKLPSLPGEVSGIRHGNELLNDNPCSDVWLNPEKSAEKTADNSTKGLSVEGRVGNSRVNGSA